MRRLPSRFVLLPTSADDSARRSSRKAAAAPGRRRSLRLGTILGAIVALAASLVVVTSQPASAQNFSCTVAAGNNNTVNVSWTDLGAVGYDVSHDNQPLVWVTSTSFVDATPGSNYKVVAWGNGTDRTTTTCTNPDPVSGGGNFSCTVAAGNNNVVNVSWTDLGAVGYDVSHDGQPLVWVTSTSFVDATPGSSYKVVAWGNGTDRTTTTCANPNSGDGNFSCTVTAGNNNVVNVSWSDLGAVGYDVSHDGQPLVWVTSTSFVDTTPGSNYKVVAWGNGTDRTTTTCSNDNGPQATDEFFRTQWPHVFVDNATNQPADLDGVNITAKWIGNELGVTRTDLQRIADNDFEVIRLQLNWPDFQTGPDSYRQAALNDLERVLVDANAVGLHVILDPLHSTGPGYNAPNWFNVPQWAWATAPVSTSESAAENAMLDKLTQFAPDYVVTMATLVADDPNVIAIDLISEARGWAPLEGNAANSSQNDVLKLYNDVITDVRVVVPEKILMIEPIYGNSHLGQANFNLISAANRQNLAMTIHYYYAGGHPTGYDSNGAVDVGFHTWDGVVGYPIATRPRATLRSQMATHLQITLDAIEPFGIPLHVGEYAINPSAPGAVEWVEDIVWVFDNAIDQYDNTRPAADVKLNRMWWRWTMDGSFQLWDGQNTKGWIIDIITS